MALFSFRFVANAMLDYLHVQQTAARRSVVIPMTFVSKRRSNNDQNNVASIDDKRSISSMIKGVLSSLLVTLFPIHYE